MLFLCENNLYAMGTALERSESETNLAVKASSYEIPAWSCDGMDVEAVWHAAHRAVSLVRDCGGPVFLEAKTFRFRAHSMYDADRYREKSEIEQLEAAGSPPAARRSAEGGEGWPMTTPSRAIDAEVIAEVDASVAFAEAGTDEPVEDLVRFVMSPGSAS